MAIVRWQQPTQNLLTLKEEFDRLFNDGFGSMFFRNLLDWPGAMRGFPIDVYQTEKEYVVKASLPGVKSEDVDISVLGDTLTIKAEMKDNTNVKEDSYLLRESRVASLSRSLTLPSDIQADKIEASLENGILTLTLLKSESAVPKIIKIKTGN
jgi:HSP20 family protein